ncbi:MAG: hypothetical protein E5Y74_19720 [Mesorhizobium sp.]|nr:MAG: hypothetical protein E5Y74_19720 [Mesorhizobium sp.]TIN03720.1 MAG: hypothetical protein E5Y34_01105 [Mesorhizobium sp.]
MLYPQVTPDTVEKADASEISRARHERKQAGSFALTQSPMGERYALFPGKPLHTCPGIALPRKFWLSNRNGHGGDPSHDKTHAQPCRRA